MQSHYIHPSIIIRCSGRIFTDGIAGIGGIFVKH